MNPQDTSKPRHPAAQPGWQPRPPRSFKPVPFHYHQEIELEVDTLTNMGQGLGRHDGWVVMVPFALPGERIRTRIYRNDKNYSEGDLMDLIRPSPDRIQAPCPVFGECGGCQYQHLRYDAQLKWKTRQVQELLLHLAKIEHEVKPAIPSPRTYAYRSKLTPHYQKPSGDNEVRIGFLRQSSRSSYVDITRCPLVSEPMNEALADLRAQTQRRHRNQALVRGGTLLLREHVDGIASDPRSIVREQVGELTFSFPAGEFFQNNPHILPSFVEYVAEQASQDGATHLVDAYCGSGLFALSAARRFEQVAGIEVSELSIQYAAANAAANGIDNARFVLGDAAAIFANIEFPSARSSVVIDPPRKGASPEFLAQLLAFGPATIVYVSCNPATQMRDLRVLLDGGYALTEAQPFDLFPQTKHLECVVTLRRQRTPESN